jgi:hypothetical protein
MTTYAPDQFDVPATHVAKYRGVPSSAEILAAMDPEGPASSWAKMTDLVKVSCGETEINVKRHDYLDGPSALGVTVSSPEADEGRSMFFGDDDPMVNWRRLIELANAATLAAQQILAIMSTGLDEAQVAR